MKQINKLSIIAIILLCVFAVPAGATEYPMLIQDDSNFIYQCQFDSNGYVWYLRNMDWTFSINSWTWAGGNVGAIADVLDDEFPLWHRQSDGTYYWYYAVYHSTCLPQVVDSVLTWDNGHTDTIPVYMPTEVVPEPSSILALSCGLIAAAGSIYRKRKNV